MVSRGLMILSLILIWSNVSSGAAGLDLFLPKNLPEGWGLIEGPRFYARKTLFEHLDGQAELYFKYGYQKSIFAIYQDQEKPENQIEIDIYEMGNILQAFGIFSRLRTEDRSGGIGSDSCLDDRSVLFYKGKYFVMLYGTEPNPPAMKELALSISSRISDPSPIPKEIGFFPTRNLKPGSIQYFSEGLLGHRFLKRGFQATYREAVDEKEKGEAEVSVKPGKEQKTFHLFLALFHSGDEAKAALKSFKKYLTKEGRVQPKTPAGFGPEAFGGEDSYQGKVLTVRRRDYLIGIVGFENDKEAEDCLSEMIRNIIK
jgi:hypothetical protein